MKIMVIDDVMMNILVLKQAVKLFGTVDGFQDSQAGLDALTNAYRSEEQYDLLFLDILMPGRNGLEVLKDVNVISRQNATGRKTKVIMVTSNGSPENVREAIRLGAAGYVLKPIQAERIQDEMHRLMAGMGLDAEEAQDGWARLAGKKGEKGQTGQAAA